MDVERIAEMFSGFGTVSVKRLFGGQGLFADGLMFALVADDVIYLKADDPAAFEREGLSPFSYAAKGGRRTIMSYWRMPERLYDDPDELAQWARTALAAAQRVTLKTKAKRPAAMRIRRPDSGTR